MQNGAIPDECLKSLQDGTETKQKLTEETKSGEFAWLNLGIV